MYYTWLGIVSGILAAISLIVWQWRRRKHKPRMMLDTKSLAIRQFLVVTKKAELAWQIYEFVTGLPDSARWKRPDVIREVSLRFKFDRYKADQVLTELERVIRVEYQDTTFSIVLKNTAPQPKKAPRPKPRN